MSTLNLAENIAKMRHEKKVTQEQLADFIGVTKASVSKWETKQSLPDLLVLPQLAAFFDVTIDELMGYEPQLSKEQQQKIYRDLSAAFANGEFEGVMEKSRKLVKQYYSCYPFLFRISCLWLNHFMLAEKEEQMKILEDASKLCRHVTENSKDIGLCSDAAMIDATIKLCMGKPQEVIESLEAVKNPCGLSEQGDGVLIQAYQMAGDMEKANDYTQIIMYKQLLSLVGCATQYINIHATDPALCEETRKRIDMVAHAYNLEDLNANSMAQFYYQMAIVYCAHGKTAEAAQVLCKFIDCVEHLLWHTNLTLSGDAYFDRLFVWIARMDMGENAPRNKKTIYADVIQNLNHPAFAILEQEKEFQKKKQEFVKKGESL